MSLVAYKFGYDGRLFHGSQKQKNKRTVQGDIEDVLREYGIADEVRIASRTDRGVSAAGNVCYVLTEEDPLKVGKIINSHTQGIFFHGYRTFSDTTPYRHYRSARSRWYRYYLLRDAVPDISLMQDAARLFVGEHDFRGFSTGEHVSTMRELFSVSLEPHDDVVLVDIVGNAFLWKMVRKMVYSLLLISSGVRDKTWISDILNGSARVDGIVPGESLVLMDIDTGFAFKKLSHSMVVRDLEGRMKESLLAYHQLKDTLETVRRHA